MMNKTMVFRTPVRMYLLLVLLVVSNALFATINFEDSSKKLLLASLNKKTEAASYTKEANVVFPEVLTGNEEQTLDYIEKFSAQRRDYLIRMYKKGGKLFPKTVTALKKHNLPEELKVLIALESAFKAEAVSKAGAVGYWQFMDDVAKEYGLKIVPQYSAEEKKKLIKKDKKKADSLFKKLARQKDERKNFSKSTYAAARYLKDRSRNLNNDLLLMVASYNCGVGNVWNAIEASGKKDASFWDIKKSLPAETQSYVMNFIAMNVIFNNYDKFATNTLIFKPLTIKADNFEQNMTDALEDAKSSSK